MVCVLMCWLQLVITVLCSDSCAPLQKIGRFLDRLLIDFVFLFEENENPNVARSSGATD
jgi:hypothetical protein